MRRLLQNYLLETTEPSKRCAGAGSISNVWSRTGAALIAAVMVAPGLAHAADAEQIVSTVCVACHGADGKGTMPMFPNLAGQQREYIKKQLDDFINGRRINELMAPSVAALKPADVDALAAYFSARNSSGAKDKSAPEIADISQLVEAGKNFFRNGNPETGVPGCTACHRVGGAGDKRYPKLIGQNPMYTAKQLADFKASVRTNDNYRLMRSAVVRMTEHEMQAVAEYLAVAGQ